MADYCCCAQDPATGQGSTGHCGICHGSTHLLHEVPLGDPRFHVIRRVGRPGCSAPIQIHDETTEETRCATPTRQPSTAP